MRSTTVRSSATSPAIQCPGRHGPTCRWRRCRSRCRGGAKAAAWHDSLRAPATDDVEVLMTPTRVPPVLVTGATGRVGRAVVDLLIDAGVPVRALTHRSEAAATLPAKWVADHPTAFMEDRTPSS